MSTASPPDFSKHTFTLIIICFQKYSNTTRLTLFLPLLCVSYSSFHVTKDPEIKATWQFFYRVTLDTITSKREMQDPKAGLEEHYNVLLLSGSTSPFCA